MARQCLVSAILHQPVAESSASVKKGLQQLKSPEQLGRHSDEVEKSHSDPYRTIIQKILYLQQPGKQEKRENHLILASFEDICGFRGCISVVATSGVVGDPIPISQGYLLRYHLHNWKKLIYHCGCQGSCSSLPPFSVSCLVFLFFYFFLSRSWVFTIGGIYIYIYI